MAKLEKSAMVILLANLLALTINYFALARILEVVGRLEAILAATKTL